MSKIEQIDNYLQTIHQSSTMNIIKEYEYNHVRSKQLYRITLLSDSEYLHLTTQTRDGFFMGSEQWRSIFRNRILTLDGMYIYDLFVAHCPADIINDIIYEILKYKNPDKPVLLLNNIVVVCEFTTDIVVSIYRIISWQRRAENQCTSIHEMRTQIIQNESEMISLKVNFDKLMISLGLDGRVYESSLEKQRYTALEQQNRDYRSIIDNAMKHFTGELTEKIENYPRPIAKMIVSYLIS